MIGLLPALLLALFAAGCGTFTGGASFLGSACAAASILGVVVAAGAPWRDPLRLGRIGRIGSILPLVFYAAVVASTFDSPVPRAGETGLLLLPIYLLFPAVIARHWRHERARRLGLRAIAGAVTAISLWALADRLGWIGWATSGRFLGSPRAAMPLGHHNLLATWLVALLPLALLPAREASRWRIAGFVAAGIGGLALLATGSFAGYAALALEALLVIFQVRRKRRWTGVAVGIGLIALGAGAGPRLGDIASGRDPSWAARTVYYRAGWEGFRASPLLGWGPGSASWTSSAFLRPVPGVSPPGEWVWELHSLPIQLLYELGLTGSVAALTLVVVFLGRRLGERKAAEDRGLLEAAILGLLGMGVASLGSAAVTVTALPIAAVVLAGAALAASPSPSSVSLRHLLPARAYALFAALLLIPHAAAHRAYERALRAAEARQPAESRRELARAVDLDPWFPLYRFRLALALGDSAPDRQEAARSSRRAAQDGRGVPTLWLTAGLLGASAGQPASQEAFERACELDPTTGLGPFYMALLAPSGQGAGELAAHAFAADPRLLAATYWESHQEDFQGALVALRRRSGLDPGWREAIVRAAPRPDDRQTPSVRLALSLDSNENPLADLSPALFRRRPWPTDWPLVQLRSASLARVAGLPEATTLRSTETSALPGWGCGRTTVEGSNRSLEAHRLRTP